jgi:Zinc finger, C2H2 type
MNVQRRVSGSSGTAERGADDEQWCPTRVLAKRQRHSSPLDEDTRHRDDDGPLEEERAMICCQRPPKRVGIAQSPQRENMIEILQIIRSQNQTLQDEIRMLRSRVAELESDSAYSASDIVASRSHLCPVAQCGKSISRHEHLRRHIKNGGSQAHADFTSTLDRIFCDLCQKPFKRPEDYTRHEKRSHPDAFERRHAGTNSAPGASLSLCSHRSAADEKAAPADLSHSVHIESVCGVDGSSLSLYHAS